MKVEQKNIKVLISEQKISARIAEIGAQINREFAGQEVVMVCVLKGSFMFFSDLVRQIKVPLTCEFLSVSSYGNAQTSSGEVKMVLDLSTPLDGRNVIVVEDIVDSGLTLRFILDLLQVRNPKALRTCALLEKPEALKAPVKVDYVGFQIGTEFVVGYGLDYAQRYRELPFIGLVET